jgi:ABC-2 type transport system ATP-binding protein
MTGIKATGLTKIYDGIRAVNELTLSVPTGSIYGFLGPNGAGKTTTMRLLTALTTPTSGSATVDGVSITDRAALTERIGYLPADPPVFDELTGREYVRYVARLHELDASETEDQIAQYLNRFDLVDDADRRIEGYSTGMRKKIGVIGAVLHQPAVLFLDEPTSGLDPRAAHTMREIIAELADEAMTIFLSTHILPVAEELADTIGVIHEGELVAEGSPAELTAQVEGEDESDLESVFLEVTQQHAPESI